MTNDDDKLYGKVAALLRKAESTTAEEAEALCAKASELIAKYELDELRARAAVGYGGPPDEIGSEFVEFRFKTQRTEDAILLQSLATPNGCQVIMTMKVVVKDGKYKQVAGAYLFGRDSARKHVLWMYSSMLVTVTRLERTAGSTWRQRRSFRIGFAVRIRERLTAVRNDAVIAVKKETGTDMLPILKSEADRLAEYIEQQIGKTKNGRSAQVDTHAYTAGKLAADRVDVGNTRLPGARMAIGAGS